MNQYNEFMKLAADYLKDDIEKIARVSEYCRDVCFMSILRVKDGVARCDYEDFSRDVKFNGHLEYSDAPSYSKVRIMRIICDALIVESGADVQFCNETTKFGTKYGNGYADIDTCMRALHDIRNDSEINKLHKWKSCVNEICEEQCKTTLYSSPYTFDMTRFDTEDSDEFVGALVDLVNVTADAVRQRNIGFFNIRFRNVSHLKIHICNAKYTNKFCKGLSQIFNGTESCVWNETSVISLLYCINIFTRKQEKWYSRDKIQEIIRG